MPRPARVTDLLLEDVTYEGWDFNNKGSKRFFISNVIQIAGVAEINFTRLREAVPEAIDLVHGRLDEDECSWVREWRNFDWDCSRTAQPPIALDRTSKPMLFDRCAILIVAMELIARDTNPALDVYRSLRIIPASHFVEGFNNDVLETLRNTDEDFARRILQEIGQSIANNVLFEKIAGRGCCLTRDAAELLATVLKRDYPSLNVGDVRVTRDDNILGYAECAPRLIVNRTLGEIEMQWVSREAGANPAGGLAT